MANQDVSMENGEDFSQDVQADQGFGQGQKLNGQNGSGDGPADSGSADAPGRDDDRYDFCTNYWYRLHKFCLVARHIKFYDYY